MFKRTLLVLFFCTSMVKAGGIIWEPPVIIDPPNPQVGDMIRVGLFEKYYPPCLGIPQENSIGETHSLVFDDNNITIEVLATTGPLCNPIPFEPAPRIFYDLGVLGEGEYVVNTNYIEVSGFTPDLIPPFPLPAFFVHEAYGSPINFIVRGAPKIVNSLTWVGMLLLIFLFLLLFIHREIKCKK